LNNGFEYESFFKKIENKAIKILENNPMYLDDFLGNLEYHACKTIKDYGYTVEENKRKKLIRPVYWELDKQKIITVKNSFLFSEIKQTNLSVSLNQYSENPVIDYKKYEKYIEPIIKPINGSPARNL